MTFKLNIELDQVNLTAAWYANEPVKFCYETYEKEAMIAEEKWGGNTRHNIVHRKTACGHDEFIAQNSAIIKEE